MIKVRTIEKVNAHDNADLEPCADRKLSGIARISLKVAGICRNFSKVMCNISQRFKHFCVSYGESIGNSGDDDHKLDDTGHENVAPAIAFRDRSGLMMKHVKNMSIEAEYESSLIERCQQKVVILSSDDIYFYANGE